MEKYKNILPIAMVFVMALVALTAVPIASAAVISNITGVVPHSNYTSANIVCSTANDSDDCLNCLNATIWYNQTGGDVEDIATAVVLCHIVETAGAMNKTVFESTDNTNCATAFEALDDAITYNFTCTFSNATAYNVVNATDNGGADLNAVSDVGVDNTAPTVTVTATYSTVNLGRYFKYTVVMTDATADLADADGTVTYCNITDAENEVDKDGVISTTATAVEFVQTDVAGTYNISCTATDTAGNTKSASTIVTAKTTGRPIPTKDGGVTTSIIGGLSRNTIILIIIVIVLLAAAMNKK